MGTPNSNLIQDSNGALYGTTTYGGASGNGTVFKLTPSGNSWTETVLYSFTGGMDGSQPYAGLIMDTVGSLYGTATFGGINNSGTVFKLTPSKVTPGTYTYTTLYNFNGTTDGSEPYGGLFLNPKSHVLYGMTFLGGSGSGTIYTIGAPATQGGPFTFTVIFTFDETNGANPSSSLRYSSTSGKLYGTTFDFSGFGNVFALVPPTQAGGQWTQNILYSFLGGADGANPLDSPTISSATVYGTTYFGGTSGMGTVYKLSPTAGQ